MPNAPVPVAWRPMRVASLRSGVLISLGLSVVFEAIKQNKYTSLATSVFLVVRRVALAILLHGVMSDYARSQNEPLWTLLKSMFRPKHMAWFFVMASSQTMQRHFEMLLEAEDYVSRLKEMHGFYTFYN